MKPTKDSTQVIEFMALFLRDWIDDDPNSLEKLAADDKALTGCVMAAAE
jgi:hypothetical protein